MSWFALGSADGAPEPHHEPPEAVVGPEVSDSSPLPSVSSAPPAAPAPAVPLEAFLAREPGTPIPAGPEPETRPVEAAASQPAPPVEAAASQPAPPVEAAASQPAPPVEAAASQPAPPVEVATPRDPSPAASTWEPEWAPEAPLSNQEIAAQLVHEGEQFFAAQRLGAGLDAWRRALALDPKRSSLYAQGAQRLLDAGHPARARAWLEPGRALDPPDPKLLMLAARLELELEGAGAALALLEAPQPGLEDAPELGSLRAALLQREQRHLEAFAAYRELVEDHPERGRLWFGLAVSAEALDRTKEADSAFRRALDDPALPSVLARHAGLFIGELEERLPPEPSR